MVNPQAMSLLRSYEAEIKRLRQQLKYQREQDELQLAEAKKAIRAILDRACQVDFARLEDIDTFQVCVQFNPRTVGGAPRYEQEFIARDVAERVYHEIATARFLIPPRRQMQYGRPNYYQP